MDPFARDREDLRATATRSEQMRDMLERMHYDSLSRAADLGNVLQRLTTLLDRVEHRLHMFEEVQRDVRLTMTGIGNLAKSLSERTNAHEEILRAVKDILVHLAAREKE